MLSLKPGVELAGLSPQMTLATFIVHGVYAKHDAEVVITSGSDGRHKLKSKHYTGDALDFRIWTLPEDVRTEVVQELKAALGRSFDVVLEKDHMHIEYDPRRPLIYDAK